MAKSKGAPKRARKTSTLYSLPPEGEHELGAGNVVDDVIGGLLRQMVPLLLPKLIERIGAPKATPADHEGRILRMETQVGYLSTTLRAAVDRIAVLEAERKH